MANYCRHPEKTDCNFLYKGCVIGTDKKLCDLHGPKDMIKPCDVEEDKNE